MSLLADKRIVQLECERDARLSRAHAYEARGKRVAAQRQFAAAAEVDARLLYLRTKLGDLAAAQARSARRL